MKKSVIVYAKRTPIGTFMGALSSLPVGELGKVVISDILENTKIDKNIVDEVIMGNVLTAGVGQAPARQAALFAGLPESVECLTINKMCGSGLKSVMLADQAIRLGDAEVVIAGGMESMSNSPYLVERARAGLKMGHKQLSDSMIKDGLWDVYNNIHMGSCAESCAKDFDITREEIDQFAIGSYKKAIDAQKQDLFKDEIIPICIKNRKSEILVEDDEEPTKVKFEKIPSLRPAFEKDGIVTAANASSVNDGAAAVMVMSEDKAKELGLTPIAEIVAHSSAAKAPIEFTTAPADAIKKVLNKANLSKDNIDLFEINEAFAVVSLAVNKILGLDPNKVNINGGAIAMGHPIGASGTRILVTLLHNMLRNKAEYGLASLCIGGGEASALIVKRYNS